jgi:hypothetical protein
MALLFMRSLKKNKKPARQTCPEQRAAADKAARARVALAMKALGAALLAPVLGLADIGHAQ